MQNICFAQNRSWCLCKLMTSYYCSHYIMEILVMILQLRLSWVLSLKQKFILIHINVNYIKS